jgi:acetyl esterase/lipase
VSNLRFAARALRIAETVPARRALRGPGRPSWSLRAELARDLVRATLDATVEFGTPWLRELQGGGALRSAAQKQVEVSPVDTGGVPAEWVIPRTGLEPRVLAYLHGGAYVIGSPETHRDLAARLALACRARVLVVDYRLAPEHRFPAAHDDSFAAWRWLVEAGAPGEDCAVAGDSAGGALAVHVCVAARDAGVAAPRAAALLCPWTDPGASGGSMQTNDPYDVLNPVFLRESAAAYLAGADIADPRMTPLRADLRSLPSLLVQGGDAEVFADQMRAFTELARKAGVETDLRLHRDQVHVFQTLAAFLPEARTAIDEIAAWLEPRWSAS